ncbi:MAG: MaoC family dehydratase [Rhodospirillales bacterium]|nr:MaoC family dehydratase [Rhodospirillales bacterium]
MSDTPETAGKANPGNYFEDFRLGQEIIHATPRTVSEGDMALYTALYGSRFAIHSSDVFAGDLGFDGVPLDDLLVFHIVFGKTVPDISLNAIANLGYAMGRFEAPVQAGDTLSATSDVIGLKENSNGKTGVVYVRTHGVNQVGETVLDYVRWVMVRKRDPQAECVENLVPELAEVVAPESLFVPEGLSMEDYDLSLSGSPHLWDSYSVGEKIDHVDGMTIEEAEHMMATRLYQNTAKVHFNQHAAAAGRYPKRIVYGGHIISLARSLSFNGLANAFRVAALNAGSHVAPTFAGDTIYAWSEVLDKAALSAHEDIGVLRLRTVAVKDKACDGFPYKDEGGAYDPAVVLDLDYWVLMPRLYG